MKKISLLIIASISAFVSFQVSNGEVLAGWHTWSSYTSSTKMSDSSPDYIISNISANAGVTVNNAFLTVGGGHQVVTSQDSNITWGGTWPGEDITTDSSVQFRPANNANRSIDFQITNTGTDELQLTAFKFHYRKSESTTPLTTEISITHLGGQSNLGVGAGEAAGTVTAASNFVWYAASIDLTALVDNTLAANESAAFQISLPAQNQFLNWHIDNVAFEGAFSVVPEPGTYALLTGIAAFTVIMLKRRK